MEAGEHDPQRFLNRAVFQNVQRMGSDKNLSLALIDYQDGRLRLSGQHETLLMTRPGQPVETIDTIDLGFPVGLVEDISDFVSHTDLILGVDDMVVLYSDGIVEAEDVKGEQYGMDRLRASIDVNRCRTAAEIKNAILNDLLTFIDSHEIYDDITLIVLKQQEQPVSC